MAKITSIAIISLLLVIAGCEASGQRSTNDGPDKVTDNSGTPATADSEIEVFITISGKGKKYHRAECPHLKDGEKQAITLKEAKKRGYTPCKTCKPPR